MGIKIFAVSVITDLGVPGKIVAISHQDVMAAAAKTAPRLTRLIIQLIEKSQ
jgi:purine-nucleoside phosphorylase